MKKYSVFFDYLAHYEEDHKPSVIRTHIQEYDSYLEAESFKRQIDRAFEAGVENDFGDEDFSWGADIVASLCYGGMIASEAFIMKDINAEISALLN